MKESKQIIYEADMHIPQENGEVEGGVEAEQFVFSVSVEVGCAGTPLRCHLCHKRLISEASEGS